MRRAIGVAVLILSVVAAAVVARLDGTRVAGRAIAPPGLTAPDVGDCVASFPDPAQAPAPGDIARGATDPTDSVIPRPLPQVGVVEETGVTFSGCTGDHLGEVVAYRRMAAQRQNDADRIADIDWCRSVAGDYRAHLQWRVADAAGGIWQPSTGQRFTAVLSAPFVDPAEPRWSACLLLPPAGETYRGSYILSLALGPAPAPFGRCLQGSAEPASCAGPHTSQEFGTGSEPPPNARHGVASCRELIGAMTGMAELTAGGRLRTELIVASPAGGGSSAAGGAASDDPAASGASSCRLSVVGSQVLTASLIGIGDAPVPLS